ncbi:hypothetical protein TRICI_004693 [Trichomonascus ciferrii]|uniref:Uncharacterized protein n=1 Tax=Trichomonascus ciferrii TaxID=44093 RepID=A0A642UZU0_9ASCO|nr:hypothetical protein TRICI_004693 [Trichomonascus ciferrii]
MSLVKLTTMTAFGHNTTSDEAAEHYKGEIEGKTVVVTGATCGGIGAETVKSIAKNGASLVVFTVRNERALNDTTAKLNKEAPGARIKGVLLDLASFDSIHKAAAEIKSIASAQIDVLINNAGVMACPYNTTKDGFELQFGTNHLGHFLLTSLLKEKLFNSPTPRVVNLSSTATWAAPVLFDDINFTNEKETYVPWVAYGQSKTANILFTNELHDKFNKSNKLSAYSLHPGAIFTNLQRHIDPSPESLGLEKDYWGNPLFCPEVLKYLHPKPVPQGAATTIVAAFNTHIPSGSYLSDCQEENTFPKSYAKDKTNAKRLWDISQQFTKTEFA